MLEELRRGFGVVDTACTRCVVGRNLLDLMENEWRCRGVNIIRGKGRGKFRFGNGGILTSSEVAYIHIGVGGVT